ncbi:3-deoxy-D-manno-octulosonic acid transferase [Rhodoflexus sp.]
MLLYNLFLLIYRIGLHVAARFNTKAATFLTGRKEQASLWKQLFAAHPHRIVWFHCASLGEFEQGRPVIENFRRTYPQYKTLLTFFSPSGYEIRKNYEHTDWTLYLPLDNPQTAQQLISLVRPELVIFVKYEFWYYYLSELHRQNIPVLLISAIFRPTQLFFKPYGKFYRQMLYFFRQIHVQDEASRQLLAQIGITHVEVSGDTRIDRVAQIAEVAAPVSIAAKFAYEEKVIVIGSLWPDDWEVICNDVKQLAVHCKFIIAPHEIDENILKKIESSLHQLKTVRYSKIERQEISHIYGARVLLIDNVGLLNRLYVYGELAYIGGGFKSGLHNILEPAAFGIPVIFGNRNYKRFREAVELLEQGGAFTIAQKGDFLTLTAHLLNQPEAWQQAATACETYVRRNVGATQRVMNSIESLLNDPAKH